MLASATKASSRWCDRRSRLYAHGFFGHGAALVFDESALEKKSEKSAGVARQWNGRLGKTENSQVGVFAAVVRDRACALVDGELFVPEK